MRALLIPAAPARREQVLTIPVSAVAISDAIGGGLIDDVVYGAVEEEGFCLYVDEEREAKAFPHNTRALMVAAGLGCLDDARRVRLRGDVLITGADEYGNDQDVPLTVVQAARVVHLVSCRFQDRYLDRERPCAGRRAGNHLTIQVADGDRETFSPTGRTPTNPRRR